MTKIFLIILLLPFSLLAQKRNDNQIILSTPDSASIVYRNMFQYLMQHDYEVINKDDKNYQITASKIAESPGAADMKVNIKVLRTDSTRAFITGSYQGGKGANSVGKDIVYFASPNTLAGKMWTNMAQLVEVHPNSKIKYNRKK